MNDDARTYSALVLEVERKAMIRNRYSYVQDTKGKEERTQSNGTITPQAESQKDSIPPKNWPNDNPKSKSYQNLQAK